MAIEIKMPQLGESVTEGTLAKWLVKPGDIIKKYDPLCEVTTDKVNAEVPAIQEGKILQLLIHEGETVSVGKVIGYIEGERSLVERVELSERQVQDKKPRFSPAVLHLATEHGVDLNQMKGSGQDGRITRKDVLAYLAQGEKAEEEIALVEEITRIPKDPPPHHDGEIAVNSIRKTIAKRMVQSKQEIPHAWTMIEADVTGLVRYRESIKNLFKEKENFSLTYLPFFIKAVVEGIKKYPLMNSVWEEDRIVIQKSINISIAVATEDALFVPVIKEADQKSIYGLAKEIESIAKRTRAGKLTADDMTGGTFTVNNTGSFGSIQSMPIINQPQAAIITMESIVKRPVVIGDMIGIRDMVNICLSLDHRILDGLISGRFLQCIKESLENFNDQTSIY